MSKPEIPPKEPPALLPCPFCGGSGVLHYQLCSLCDWEVICEGCGASTSRGGIRYTAKEAIDDWNTRIVDGHRVTFHAENPGVVGPTAVWLVPHGGYMYGPCERWQDVEKIVREEWEHDRNLVG